MAITKALHPLTRLDRILAIRKADKRKALGTIGFAVLGQKHARDVPEAREHLAQLVLLGKLGQVRDAQGRQVVALVLAAALMRSPVTLLPRRCGGT